MSSLIEFYIPWLKNKQQKNNHASGITLTDNGQKTSLRPLSNIGELIKRRGNNSTWTLLSSEL